MFPGYNNSVVRYAVVSVQSDNIGGNADQVCRHYGGPLARLARLEDIEVRNYVENALFTLHVDKVVDFNEVGGIWIYGSTNKTRGQIDDTNDILFSTEGRQLSHTLFIRPLSMCETETHNVSTTLYICDMKQRHLVSA